MEQNQEGAPMEPNMMQGVAAEAKGQEMSPALKKELTAYKSVVNKVLHSKETRDEVLQMISGGDVELAVPPTALEVDKMASGVTKGKVSTNARLAGGVYIVSELLELGTAAGYWEAPSEQQAQSIFQDTLQDYIEIGLKDGSIDPVELQKAAEPFMNDQQKQTGAQAGAQYGIPAQGNPYQAVANQKTMKRNQENAAARQQAVTPMGEQKNGA